MSATTIPVGELWNQIRQLPASERLSFATRILRSLEQDSGETCPPKKSFADLVGIMATGQAPPTDEEVEQILDDERQRKFR